MVMRFWDEMATNDRNFHSLITNFLPAFPIITRGEGVIEEKPGCQIPNPGT